MKTQINEIKRMQQLAGIINESQLNETDSAANVAQYVADPFGDYIVPGSEKYTYGPDEEGTYHLEFMLAFDSLDYDTPEDEEKALQDQIGGRSSGGPGQAFSNTNVSYEGEQMGKYIFSVHRRGGYDI